MKCLLAFVLGVLLITVESKPAAQTETEPANNQPIQLADRIKEAQELITNLGTQLQQQFNLPNQDELANTFKEQSKNLANSVQQYVANITEELQRATSSHT